MASSQKGQTNLPPGACRSNPASALLAPGRRPVRTLPLPRPTFRKAAQTQRHRLIRLRRGGAGNDEDRSRLKQLADILQFGAAGPASSLSVQRFVSAPAPGASAPPTAMSRAPAREPYIRIAAGEEDAPPTEGDPAASPTQALRNVLWARATAALKALEPKNPLAYRTFLGSGPKDEDLRAIDEELDAARQRAAARGHPVGQVTRPTWQESQRSIDEALPSFQRQVPFLNGTPVTFRTAGSTIPDNVAGSDVVETKSY